VTFSLLACSNGVGALLSCCSTIAGSPAPAFRLGTWQVTVWGLQANLQDVAGDKLRGSECDEQLPCSNLEILTQHDAYAEVQSSTQQDIIQCSF
jgi:hypothetical protein